jgi:hypothetical protein
LIPTFGDLSATNLVSGRWRVVLWSAAAFAIAALAWSVLSGVNAWQRREIPASSVEFAVNADGTRLATVSANSAEQALRLWNIESVTERAIITKEIGVLARSVQFSPNGKWLAVQVSDSQRHGVIILDGESGDEIAFLDARLKSISRIFEPEITISHDSAILVLRTHCYYGTTNTTAEPLLAAIQSWRTSDWGLTGSRLIPGAWYVRASNKGLRLVEIASMGSQDRTIRICEFESGRELCRFALEGGAPLFPQCFSPDAAQFGIGSRVVSLKSRTISNLQCDLEMFSTDGKQILAIQHGDRTAGVSWADALPIVRHAIADKRLHRLAVFDSASLQKIKSSQKTTDRLREYVRFSANGTKAVARADGDSLSIWAIPD